MAGDILLRAVLQTLDTDIDVDIDIDIDDDEVGAFACARHFPLQAAPLLTPAY